MIDYCGRLDVVLHVGGWNGTDFNSLAAHTQTLINHDSPSYHDFYKKEAPLMEWPNSHR